MKNMSNFKYLSVFALAISLLFASCDDNAPTVIIQVGDDVNISNGGKLLRGSYDTDITLKSGEVYKLSGGVHITNGAKITIQNGVTIQSDPSVTTAPYCYLMVEQGATIEAIGTQNSPIVFTSGSAIPAPGDWGGIIINGYAPVNKAGTAGGSVDSEIAGFPYGGAETTDNSGTLKYVRVEYGGAKIDSETEHNGFTFNGVGNGTTVDYIEAWNGTDDGIECFGGSVNMKHVISWGNTDDGFDWTYGYTGKVQYLLVKTGETGDRGIEGDNNKSTPDATPWSNPVLSQVTLISSGTPNEDDNMPQGIEFRRGTRAVVMNAIIENFNESARVSDEQTNTNVNDGSLALAYAKTSHAFTYRVPALITDESKRFENVATVETSFDTGIDADNFDVTFSGGVAMTDAFFDGADFIGACNSSDMWWADWARFGGSTDAIVPNDPSTNVSAGGTLLQGSYDANVTLVTGASYVLSGGVHFTEGTTLTIEPGVIIKSDPNIATAPYCYLMMEQGSTINAEGTVDAPILFTSGTATPAPGDWGGIIINGYATVNKAGTPGGSVDSEIAGFPYGGDNDNDNSGILKYVIVEFGGAKIDPETEHNGFTFNAVGDATTVDYIQAVNGTDDGIECFGGTVNMKHVVSWNNTDDGFDWTYGYKGKVQYLVVKTGDTGDRGMEGDNNKSTPDATPWSNPTIVNFVLIASGTANEDGNMPQGIEARRGTKAQYINGIVSGFETSVRVSDEQTNTNVDGTGLEVDYVKLSAGIEYKVEANVTDKFETSANVELNAAVTSNYVQSYAGGKDMSADSFFDTTDYMGAVVDGSDWTADWTRGM